MIRSLILGIGWFSSALVHAEEAIWENNKITEAQPFPGKVFAVEPSWGGYRLFIESLEGEERRYCVAQVWPGGSPNLSYQPIAFIELPKPSGRYTFVTPAVEVSRFSWSMGPWKIGRIFGEEDCLKIVLSRKR